MIRCSSTSTWASSVRGTMAIGSAVNAGTCGSSVWHANHHGSHTLLRFVVQFRHALQRNQAKVVAGEDITHGLPRVVELFEARTPKGVAPISEAAGRIRIEDTDKARKLVVVPDDGSEEVAYAVSKRSRLLVADEDHVEVGQQLVVGAIDPKQVLRILGPRAVQRHLVDQVQGSTAARACRSTTSTSR